MRRRAGFVIIRILVVPYEVERRREGRAVEGSQPERASPRSNVTCLSRTLPSD